MSWRISGCGPARALRPSRRVGALGRLGDDAASAARPRHLGWTRSRATAREASPRAAGSGGSRQPALVEHTWQPARRRNPTTPHNWVCRSRKSRSPLPALRVCAGRLAGTCPARKAGSSPRVCGRAEERSTSLAVGRSAARHRHHRKHAGRHVPKVGAEKPSRFDCCSASEFVSEIRRFVTPCRCVCNDAVRGSDGREEEHVRTTGCQSSWWAPQAGAERGGEAADLAAVVDRGADAASGGRALGGGSDDDHADPSGRPRGRLDGVGQLQAWWRRSWGCGRGAVGGAGGDRQVGGDGQGAGHRAGGVAGKARSGW